MRQLVPVADMSGKELEKIFHSIDGEAGYALPNLKSLLFQWGKAL